MFTHYIVEALDGKADRDGDGLITVSELYDTSGSASPSGRAWPEAGSARSCAARSKARYPSWK